MPLRDIAIFLIVAIGIPFILRNPAVGIGYWVWISLMNPHRGAWGFAYSFHFAFVIAVATMIGLFLNKEPRRLKGGAAAWVLLAFVMWMCFTTLFALEPAGAIRMLERVVKIHVRHLPGAVHTLQARTCDVAGTNHGRFDRLLRRQGRRVHANARRRTGLVWGPPETFIADNNALALALIMTIPLLAYVYIMSTKRWMRAAIAVSIVLCAVSVLGTYSRGGLLAIIAMSAFLWIKAKSKLWLGLLVVLARHWLLFLHATGMGRANGYD